MFCHRVITPPKKISNSYFIKKSTLKYKIMYYPKTANSTEIFPSLVIKIEEKTTETTKNSN